jgi:hypothetical protein
MTSKETRRGRIVSSAILLLVANACAAGSQAQAIAISAPATYSNPSGAFAPMPATTMTVNLTAASKLMITFSARGTVQPSGSQIIPIVFIKCEVDGTPCQPNGSAIEFLYPQFCCDTRSFTWVANTVPPGTHSVSILWGMGNPTSAVVTNRTLAIQPAAP